MFIFLGSFWSINPVGWTCTIFISIKLAPILLAIFIPDPFAWYPLVDDSKYKLGTNYLIKEFYVLSFANPPVHIITDLALKIYYFSFKITFIFAGFPGIMSVNYQLVNIFI